MLNALIDSFKATDVHKIKLVVLGNKVEGNIKDIKKLQEDVMVIYTFLGQESYVMAKAYEIDLIAKGVWKVGNAICSMY